jgi:drug/metabolite transporter (DMT)-like permease
MHAVLERRTAVLWVLASAVSYSLFAVFSKQVFANGLRATDLVVWRFALATPLAWMILLVRRRRGGPGPLEAPVRPMLLLGALFGVLALLAFTGLERIPAALYTVIIYTYPAMVAVGAWIMGRPAPRALWGALVLTMAGIALTVPEVFSAGGGATTGLILTLSNAAFYAVYVLISGRLMGSGPSSTGRRSFDGFATTTWSLTGSLLFALGVAAVCGVRAPSSAGAMFGIVGLAVVSTVVAGATLMIGLGSLPAPTAATIATFEPVLTLIWAVTLLDETLQPVQLVGAALVLAGVTWAQRVGTAGSSHRIVPADGPAPATASAVSSPGC